MERIVVFRWSERRGRAETSGALGNNLASFYKRNPDDYISGPLELPIPEYLDRILTDYYNNP